MATSNDIIQTAKKYIGTKEYPAGSNCVVFNKDYYGCNVKGDNYPWCATFVWDIFRLSNASNLFFDGKKTAYCPDIQNWGVRNNLIVPVDKAKQGDVVLFDFDGNKRADHVGFIFQNQGNGVFTTIEGNTSLTSNDNGGCVMYRQRYKSQILAVIHPKYDVQVETNTPSGEEYNMKQIQYGSKGKSVKIWQIICGATSDGDFGTKTRQKTIEWQTTHMGKSEADGIVGPKTWKAGLESL